MLTVRLPLLRLGSNATRLLVALDEGVSVATHPQKIETFVLPQDLIDPDVPVHTTPQGIEFVRTPDDRFVGLEGYDFTPHYLELDGLRVHYLDEGPSDGPVVVLVHGQPVWSYLYRTMIPPLVEAGYRVVAWDNIGFGRSDKPIDPAFHTYLGHVEYYHRILAALDLTDVTLFCQDWGGVIGLRVVADDPDRFIRVVAANTGLVENSDLDKGDDGFFPLPQTAVLGSERRGFLEAAMADDTTSMSFRDSFRWWIEYCLYSADLRPGECVFGMGRGQATAEVMAGYNAPFPSYIYSIAPHVFPSMVPTIGDLNVEAWAALGRFDKPFLYFGGDYDNIGTKAVQRRHVEHIPGAAGQPHERFPVGHFIQEEIGPVMAARLVAFIES